MIFAQRFSYMFNQLTWTFVLSMMQFTVNILTQFVCMLFMANHTKISSVVIDFIALVAIARLDEVYFEFKQSNLKDHLQAQKFTVPLGE